MRKFLDGEFKATISTPLHFSIYEQNCTVNGSTYDDLTPQTSSNLHISLVYLMRCTTQTRYKEFLIHTTLNIIYSNIHKEPNLGSKPHKIDLTSCAISQLLCIKSVSCIGLLHVKFLQVWNWLILISRFSRLQFLSGVVVILCTVLAQLCVFLISVSLQPSLKKSWSCSSLRSSLFPCKAF